MRGELRLLVALALVAVNSGTAPALAPLPATLGWQFELAQLLAAEARSQRDGYRAARLFDAGRYREAILAYTIWTPRSGCGTCNAEMEAERRSRIEISRALLTGDHAAASRVCLRNTWVGGWGRDVGLERLMFRFYREAGQLDNLMCLADATDEAERVARAQEVARHTPEIQARFPAFVPTRTRFVRELRRLAMLGERRDVAALIAACHERGPDRYDYNYALRTAAAEELAACGAGATTAVVEAVEAELRRADPNRNPSWLVQALGVSADPAAFEALKGFAARERELGHEYRAVVGALAMKGEAGLRLVSDEAKARYGVAHNQGPAAPLAKPAPGSLPKELPK